MPTVSASVIIAAPSGLSGAVTAAHLHLGTTDGINSGTLIHLCGGGGGTASCSLDNGQGQTFTVDLPTTLMSPVPLIYLNLHTAQNPGGEIRGQLVQLTGPTPAPPSPPSPVSTREIIVPLLLGESENRLQGSSGSVPFIKSYNATAHSGVDTTAQSSNIVATITPQTQEIRFSDIVIRDLPVDVTAAHIHGPCADATPCSNGPVVYTICSPCPTSSGNTSTIPGFTVDLNQLNGNFSTAIGLYQGIMYSNRLYYLNFHTQR